MSGAVQSRPTTGPGRLAPGAFHEWSGLGTPVFSGGDYEEVRRWVWNFATSHAKRESTAIECLIDAEGAREGQSYGLRLRLGERVLPAATDVPLELQYPDVAQNRGSIAWCHALAERVRALARQLSDLDRASRKSA